MQLRTFTSISHVSEHEWDEIVPGNCIIRTHRYLKAMEITEFIECQHHYIALYDKNKIIAHASLYFIPIKLDFFAKGFMKRVVNSVRSVWKNFLILSSAECGSPLAVGNTISFREGTDKIDALKQIVHETERLAAKSGIGIVIFRDFFDHELGAYNMLTELGYSRVHNLPHARFKIRWNSFEEYLDSMRSQYRRKIRGQIRRSHRGETTIELIKDFSPYASDLARLWNNVSDHAKEYAREVLREDFFENVDKYLGEQSSVIMIKLNGQPVGFTLLIFDDETLSAMVCGLDYIYSKEYFIYFNLYYKAIEVGIQRGMKDIDLGITTLAPKIDLGADVIPLHIYMKHLNPLLNRIVPRVFAAMTPQRTPPFRRVFKR